MTKGRVAMQRMSGLPITGIVGLLGLGYKKGLIQDIDAIISALHAIQFHLPRNVEDLIKN
jgi:predicted nucleic acid-binding protein